MNTLGTVVLAVGLFLVMSTGVMTRLLSRIGAFAFLADERNRMVARVVQFVVGICLAGLGVWLIG